MKTICSRPDCSNAKQSTCRYCRQCANAWMREARRSGKFPNRKSNYRMRRFGKISIREHRLVMMLALGRKLDRLEHVHHKNGPSDDYANLEILNPKQHYAAHHNGGMH